MTDGLYGLGGWCVKCNVLDSYCQINAHGLCLKCAVAKEKVPCSQCGKQDPFCPYNNKSLCEACYTLAVASEQKQINADREELVLLRKEVVDLKGILSAIASAAKLAQE